MAGAHALASSDFTELSRDRGSRGSHEQRSGLPARGASVKGGATASDSRHFQLHKRASLSYHLHQQQLHSSELGITHALPLGGAQGHDGGPGAGGAHARY